MRVACTSRMLCITCKSLGVKIAYVAGVADRRLWLLCILCVVCRLCISWGLRIVWVLRMCVSIVGIASILHIGVMAR